MKARALWFVVMVLLSAVVVWAFVSCQKQPITQANAAQSTSSKLQVKLEVWYNLSDSIQVSPAHPCGSLQPGYTHSTESWYECQQPTNSLHYVTAQQTGADLLLSDSLKFSIYLGGVLIKEVSGKKLLTVSYTY